VLEAESRSWSSCAEAHRSLLDAMLEADVNHYLPDDLL